MNSKEKLAFQLIDSFFQNRTTLISFLRDEIKMDLPKNMKKEDAIKLIIETGKEQQFCEAISRYLDLGFKFVNFREVYELYKLQLMFEFFRVKEIIQMADFLSKHGTKWAFKKRNKNSLIRSIIKNSSAEEITGYVQRKIQKREIPVIQGDKYGWILGPAGLVKALTQRTTTMMKDMIKFLLKHINYPSPYLEFKEKIADKIDFAINKHDQLLKENICQYLLVTLTDDEIFRVFNCLIDEGSVKDLSIERYWNFVVTPFGVFKPPYFGEKNLAKVILKTFKEGEVRARIKGNGITKDLILQKCITEPPNKLLTSFFGTGPYLIKLARRIGLVGLSKIEENDEFVQSILLRLGFEVPPQLESIVGLSSKLQGYLKEVRSDGYLAEGKWNYVFSSLERMLEDLLLFYVSVLREKKLEQLEEEKWEAEIKDWLRKTFRLKKQFDYLTLGELFGLLGDINRFSLTKKMLHRKLDREDLINKVHLRELDFVIGRRTELTGVHKKRSRKKCNQSEILERLIGLLDVWISEKGISRTYPHMIRLKEHVTTEFGVTYYKVVEEEGRSVRVKTPEFIQPEEIYFMIGRDDNFPIDPLLVKKYW